VNAGDLHQPIEFGRILRTRLAVEVRDAVTLERISDGLTVTADGLYSPPRLSAGRVFVWLLPRVGMPIPTHVSVDPGNQPYQKAELDLAPVAPNQTAVAQIQLAPTRAYPFTSGLTVVRAALIRDALESPVQPLSDVSVLLQWIDDTKPGTVWVDAPTESVTDVNGDFAALLRFTATQQPRLSANGLLRIRLAGTYTLPRRYSPELTVPVGRVIDPVATKNHPSDPTLPYFRWTDFQP
jgi:hypothetical protein